MSAVNTRQQDNASEIARLLEEVSIFFLNFHFPLYL